MLSDTARTILEARYLRRDAQTHEVVETPDELWSRVALAVASPERDYGAWGQVFFDLLYTGDFLPNSPTLMNAGLPQGDLAACVVLPIEDSMESIYGTLYNAAMLHRWGAGTGFDFSSLRPNGAFVHKTSGIASGPVSFLRVYDASTQEIKQGGKRRGANMATLRYDHPDIEDFITCKDAGNQKITNFNISVTVEDSFMKAVQAGSDYDLKFDGKTYGTRNAKEVLRMIAQKAWETGDPGLMYLDTINWANPTPSLGRIATSNPCSESQLLPYEECVLGSINLANFVLLSGDKGFDWARLRKVVHNCVRFLDNVIDVNHYTLPELEQMHRNGNRKIGLGVMGWADALIKLGIPYASAEAKSLGSALMNFINMEAHMYDAQLAAERGNFPNWEQHYVYKNTWGKQRNAHVTVIAPTGTISLIAGVSSGIEPLFAVTMTSKNRLDGKPFTYVHPLLDEYAAQRDWPEEVFDYAMETGRLNHPAVSEADQQIWQTAHEIHSDDHLDMLASFQAFVDNGVSKTINLPEQATVDNIVDIYTKAHKQRIKTVCVYRDGCKRDTNGEKVQVLYAGATEQKKEGKDQARPGVLQGVTHKLATSMGTMYVTVNRNGSPQPIEVFATIGKAGTDVAAMTEALGRTVSTALQHGVAPAAIAHQLEGIGGASSSSWAPSVPAAMGKVLTQYIDGVAYEAQASVPATVAVRGDLCPNCGGATLVPTGTCNSCTTCGFSRC